MCALFVLLCFFWSVLSSFGGRAVRCSLQPCGGIALLVDELLGRCWREDHITAYMIPYFV